MTTTEKQPSIWAQHHYTAFISYARIDKAIGERFQKGLERYRIPKPLVARNTLNGPVPKRLVPIFRDMTDLGASSDLGAGINRALGRSAFLVVLCSPASAASKWVNAEIETFKRQGGGDRIIAVLVDGVPAEHHPDTAPNGAFPPALMRVMGADGQLTDQRETEPIAPDLRPEAEGFEYGILKTIAAMIGLAPDILSQRQAEMERKERRTIRRVALIVSGLAIIASMTAFAAYNQLISARESQSRAFAGLAWNAINDGQYDRAARLALQAVPAGEGLLITTGSDDADDAMQAALWNNRTLARIQPTLESDTYQIVHAELSADGSTASVVGSVGGVRVLDFGSGRLKISVPWAGRIAEDDFRSVYTAALNADGSRLLTFPLDPWSRQFDEAACGIELDRDDFEMEWFSSLGVIWDTETGCPTGTIGPEHQMRWVPGGFKWSPDGNTIVASDWYNRNIHIYDVASGNVRFSVKTDPEDLRESYSGQAEPDPELSRDSAAILTKTGNWQVSLLDTMSGTAIRRFEIVQDAVVAEDYDGVADISFAENERFVLVSTYRGETYYFNAQTGAVSPGPARVTIRGDYVEQANGRYSRQVSAFAAAADTTPIWSVRADQHTVAAGSERIVIFQQENGTVRDINTGETLFALNGHAAPASIAVAHPQLPIVLSGAEDGEIRLWNLVERPPIRKIDRVADVFSGGQIGFQTLDTGRQIVSLYADLQAEPASIDFGTALASFQVFERQGMIVAHTQDQRLIVRFTETGDIVGEIANVTQVASPVMSTRGDKVAYLREDGTLVAAAPDGTGAVAIDPAGLRWRQVAMSENGEIVIGMSSDLVAAFSTITGDQLWTFEGFVDSDWVMVGEEDTAEPRLEAKSMIISPDGSRLMIKYDNSPRVEYPADHGILLDVVTGEVISRMPFGTYERLHSSWFSPDGALLVTTGSAETGQAPGLRVWDPRDSSLRATIRDAGAIARVGISPSGNRLVTRTGDDVALWATQSGRKLADLPVDIGDNSDRHDLIVRDGYVGVLADDNVLHLVAAPAEMSGTAYASKACDQIGAAQIAAFSAEELAAVDIPNNRLNPCDRVGLLSPKLALRWLASLTPDGDE